MSNFYEEGSSAAALPNSQWNSPNAASLPVRHAYPLAVRDPLVGAAIGLVLRTLPYALMRFAVLPGARSRDRVAGRDDRRRGLARHACRHRLRLGLGDRLPRRPGSSGARCCAICCTSSSAAMSRC